MTTTDTPRFQVTITVEANSVFDLPNAIASLDRMDILPLLSNPVPLNDAADRALDRAQALLS